MTKLSISTTRVKFGDVAINSTTVSADPEAEGFDRYIIGKHIPEDADRIETWGPVGDSDFGPRIRTIFQPGDVICTTRGPKLKVARVDFKGLGAHTNFYLRTADPEVLLQPYLEAVVRSNGFQQHLVNNFRGSVNLFVNWSDAAKYEFALPPLEEQRRIAEVLQAMEVSNNRLQTLAEKSAKMLEADLVATLEHGPDPLREQPRLPKGWTFTPLGDLISIRHGFAFDGKCFTEEATDDPILLTPGNFSETGELKFPADKTKRFNGDAPDGFWLQPGDLAVLMTDLTPTAFLLGVPGVVTDSTGPILQNQRIGLVENLAPERVSDRFLFYSFLGQQLRRMIRALSAGTTVHHTSPKDICSLRIPLPPAKEQIALCRRWDAIASSRRNAVDRLADARVMQRTALLSALPRGEQ